jgi:AAA15 family ATPase/GTPase
LRQINRVLAHANLEIQIELVTGDSLEAVHARRGARYPITEMSDGEKSALLLAAEILTKEAGTVQVIDEPERHLHRSISAPTHEGRACQARVCPSGRPVGQRRTGCCD